MGARLTPSINYVTMLCLADIPVMAVTLQAVLFSFGSILCYPLFSVRLPYYAGNEQLGSYYGFYASCGGCVALLSNVIVGRMLGNPGTKPPEILWYVLFGVGVLFGWLLYRQLSSEDKQSESRPVEYSESIISSAPYISGLERV